MIISHRQKLWLSLLVFAFSFGISLHAQQRPTGGGANRNQGAGRATGTGGLGASSGGTRQYNNNGTVGEATVTSDPETRRLIVITDDETSKFVSQVITNLDRPKSQVLIKVVFLEVTYRNTLDIGLEGGIKKRVDDAPATLLASNLFGLAAQGAGGFPGAGLYQIAGNDYQVTLRAIAEAGKTEVLSRPSILARNNQQATITVGQTLPFITNARFDTLGNQINTIQYQDVGIILRVTPFITSDGMVEMIVSPEISSLTDQTVQISTGVNAPVIAKRAADTVVVTPDGQTVIIGGLMQNSKTSTDSKIPFLGDIPGLGNLFKRKIKGDVKTELMIFLTPHIINQPPQLAAVSQRERDMGVLTHQAFSEQELDRFLDGLPVKDYAPPKTRKKK